MYQGTRPTAPARGALHTAFFMRSVVCVMLMVGSASFPAIARDEPGFSIVSAPAICAEVSRTARAFENAYQTRNVDLVLAAGDKYRSALVSCDLALLTARGDFPTSQYLDEERIASLLADANVSLKLGFAALRGKQQSRAKEYFVAANSAASHVGSTASNSDRAAALDIMKRSKAEADQLERYGY